MKKMLLGMAIATALYGCGSETLEDVKKGSETVTPQATVKFDPSNGALSVPNDLLFLGTTDGTLNMPGEVATPDYTDPQTSLGALDGWSTQSPYQIELIMPLGLTLDAGSVNATSVRLFEVVMGASLTDEQCQAVPAGIACKFVKELQYGIDFVASASGNNVGIVPLKPFTQGASYINVITNALQDSEGRSISPSSSYALVQKDINEFPLVTPDQLALQTVINSYENAVVQSGSIAKDEIIYSSAMTIQSAGNVITTIKGLLAASLSSESLATPAVMMGPSTGLNVGQVIGVESPSLFDEVKYEKGSITLPSYRKVPASSAEDGLDKSYWQGLCDNAVAVQGFQAQVGDAFPMEPISEADAVCFNLSGGLLRDLTALIEIDPERHLTKFNSIPKTQSYESVPVQLTKPGDSLTLINATRAQLGMGDLIKPDTGWPVVILQHGITSKKEDMLALTASLTLQGFATIAIDHPIHGERGIDVDGKNGDDFNATTLSVLHYMNLNSMLVARDNLRQSMADLLGLRLGLNFIQGESDLNTLDVSFVGHSLGAISGPGFINAANTSIGNPQADALFKVQSAALASGAGGIAGFLLESESFGPFIQGSVLLGAGIEESTEFDAYLQSPPAECLDFIADQQAFVSCAYNGYVASLVTNGEQQKIANIQAVMSAFVFASQTALDAADPNSIYQQVASLDTPIYQSVVVGDDLDNRPDTVIPPAVTPSVSAVAGTIPSARLMGLNSVTESQSPSDVPGKYLVKFIYGHHGSVLTPAPAGGATVEQAAAANAEMQFQIATFLASRGYALSMLNTAIVTE